VTALLTVFSQFVGSLIGGAEFVGHVLDIVISFAFVILLFAMIYKFVPDVQIQWKDVWIGAALTSILFTIGKFVIGLYLGSRRRDLCLWRRRFVNYCLIVGFLFIIDIFIGRRIHAGLCKYVWIRGNSRRAR
jgi:hypothetical protein